MADPGQLAILKQGVAVWNEWRRINPETRPDLSGAILPRIDLRANLSSNLSIELGLVWLIGDTGQGREYEIVANLTDANLSHAKFVEGNLSGADLRRAKLRGSNLNRVDFTGANLAGANLARTQLTDANFNGAVLTRADFTGAALAWTSFGNVDLRGSRGLESIIHRGPSSIGLDTIYKSKGNIPEVFLRGCGVPDVLIEYTRSLIKEPGQFHSVFISHSGRDKPFCAQLYTGLQENGVRVWYFPEDAKWGESVWREIDDGVRAYDKLIVVCSKNSLQSGPVLREIERALNREDREEQSILFPLTLDDYIFDGWEHPRKTDVLTKVVGDFRDWNNGAKYRAAFKKLVKALKAKDT